MNKNNTVKKRLNPSSGMIESTTWGSYLFDAVLAVMMLMIIFVSIIPMWHTLMCSISDGQRLLAHDGLVVLPVGDPTLRGYQLTLRDESILLGYMNTIIYVAGSAGLGFVMNTLGGYVLSRRTKLGSTLSFLVVFTMIFSGGTIPLYMVNRALGLVGTRWAMILPHCTNAAFMVMCSKGFRMVPESTVEAAKLDGAGQIRIAFQIVLPQAVGFVMVTVMNSAIMAWNAWYAASIYVPTDKTRWPLQLWIRELIAVNADFMNYTNPDYARYLIQYCVIIVATLPLIAAFPLFITKLEKGMAAGGVKE